MTRRSEIDAPTIDLCPDCGEPVHGRRKTGPPTYRRCGKKYGKNRQATCVLQSGHTGPHATRLPLFQILPGQWNKRPVPR